MDKLIDVPNSIPKELGETDRVITDTEKEIYANVDDLNKLQQRIQILAAKLDIKKLQGDGVIDAEFNDIVDFNEWLENNVFVKFNEKDIRFDLSKLDILAASLIGGLAVVVDFLVVKIPKDHLYQGKIPQEGSPLTGFLRSIGHSENGEASDWVKWLENNFKVPYDASHDKTIEGLCPQYHRLMSLAHDPYFGFVFALFDINNGTSTFIDKNNNFVIKKVAETSESIDVIRPIFTFIGHILSDVTTSMGIPIPGWCLLKTIPFGDFGEKHRSLGEIVKSMYYNGYDLRHLVTMSTVPMVIELLTEIYFRLASEVQNENKDKVTEEYLKIKNTIKKHRLLEICYAIATSGNIAKIITYNGNPTSFNLRIWLNALREAFTAYQIYARDTKTYEEIIEKRIMVDKNWQALLEMSSKMYEETKNM